MSKVIIDGGRGVGSKNVTTLGVVFYQQQRSQHINDYQQQTSNHDKCHMVFRHKNDKGQIHVCHKNKIETKSGVSICKRV